MSVLTAEDALRETKRHLDKSVGELRADLEAEIAELKRGQHPKIAMPGTGGETPKPFSILRYAAGCVSSDWNGAEHEHAVFSNRSEAKRKSLSLGSSASAGDIVPDQQSSEIIQLLRANAIVSKLGARTLSGLNRTPYILPRQLTASTGNWRAEGAAITESDLTVDTVSLSPHSFAAMTTMSLELAIMADDAAEQLVRDDFTKVIQLGIDAAAMLGTGAGGSPTGIVNTAGIQTSAVSSTPTYAELIAFPQKLDSANALNGRLGWAMNPSTYWQLQQLRDSSSSHSGTELVDLQLNRRNLADGPNPMLLGFPVITSTALPSTVGAANSIIFGDWSQLLLGFWSNGVRIEVSADAAFTTASVKIRALVFADVGVRVPAAFVVAT